MLELNTHIFNFLHSFGNIPGIGLLADVPIFFIPLFLSGVWLCITFKKIDTDYREKLLHIFYACALGIILSYIIKQFVDIDRPDAYLEQTGNLIMGKIPEKSFPSDHATVSFAFGSALLLSGFKQTGHIFLLFAIIMNISRIIVGVHWPLDIFAGTILGISSAFIFFKYLEQGKLVKKLDSLIIKIMQTLKLY